MSRMNPVEIHYRLVVIRERVQQLQAELIAVGDDLGSEVAVRILGQAERKLSGAAEALRIIATANSPAAVLEMSIASLEERRQCAAVGAQVLRFPAQTGTPAGHASDPQA